MKKFFLLMSMFLSVVFGGCFVACGVSTTTSSSSPAETEKPVSITAVYEQSTQVFADTSLDDLRADLTVSLVTTVQTIVVEDYALSGTLVAPEAVITVTYNPVKELTTTFTVTVSAGMVHEHVFTDYQPDNNATCGKDGTKTAKCDYEFCEEKSVLVMEGTALTHSYTTYVKDNNAKCGQDGTKTAQCDHGCGTTDSIADEGTALTHSYTTYVKDNNATCSQDGTKTAQCDHGCGASDTVADENSVVDHVYENYKLNDDATCEKDGTKTGSCKFGCGKTETVAAVGSALGHSYKESECERCDKTNYLSVVTAPTVASTYYYGEKYVFTTGVVKDELGATVTNGSWSAMVDYTASADTKTIKITATATFTGVGTTYKPVSAEVNITLHAVAMVGATYYATVDGALAAANAKNAGTVYVLPKGNTVDVGKAKVAKTIAIVNEIKSGVTLALPYAEDEMDEVFTYVSVLDSDAYKTSAFGKTNFLCNQIFIAQNHTVANAGTIDIAGQISGGASMNYATGKNYANSVTAGNHAQINLGANAQLTSTGTVNCYGFINEEKSNNGSQFIVENGGETTVLFTIVEYRGASVYFGMIDPKNADVNSAIASAAISGLTGVGKYTPDTLQTSPINRFYIESVTAKTTVKHGGLMKGQAVLFADGENYETIVNIINSTDGIIALKANTASVTYKYNYSTHKTDLDIYGDMTLNPLQLKLTITKSASSITTTVQITLTTGATGKSDGVFFPISDYFDISLNAVNGSATVDALGQKVKLLPGATLTIGEGVTVNANEIAVYANNNLLKNGVDTHYTTNTPANLIVCGTLNVKCLGGTVKVGGNNARLNISKATSVISKEISGTVANQTTTINLVLTSASLPYTGVVYPTDASAKLTANGTTYNGEALGVNEYAVKDGKWCPAYVTVTYVLNGGSASETSKKFTFASTVATSDLATPTRANYEFLGWYTTENFASGTEYTSSSLTKDITLYAKWQQMQGKILVEFKVIGTNADDIEKTSTFVSQEISETTKKAVEPAKGKECNEDVSYARYVVGYYADANGTVAFDFTQEITASTTIYVKWAQKIVVTVSKGANVSSLTVTVGGKTVSATTFYVVPNAEIKVTAKGGTGWDTAINITESYGGKSASGTNSVFQKASATLTFNASGDTTISVVGS